MDSSEPISASGDPDPRSLDELEARLRRDLHLLIIPPAGEWLEPRTHPQWGPMLDVAFVGAGMAGLSAAFALKRLGQPPEIIGAALYLASDASAYTSGSIIRVDGGITRSV